MKRLYFALVIFIIMVVIVGTGTYTVKTASSKISKTFDSIETAANNNDIAKAVELCEKAENDWIKYEKKLSLFVNHADICEIGVSISAMTPLIKHNEKAEFFSALNEARVQLTHLASMENINNT